MWSLCRYTFFGCLIVLGGVQVASADCSQFIKPQDVLECALEQHPEVKQALARAEQGQKLGEIAAQRPNPELDGSALAVKGQGDGLSSQVTLSHIFELGGKRSARLEKAQAENQILSAGVLKAKEETALSTVSALYRIRQIEVEIATIDEALHTFTLIEKQLKARPRLTPDQEVALATFQLVASDYRLRKKALSGEKLAHVKLLELSIGRPLELSPQILPSIKEAWPTFVDGFKASEFQGSDISRLRASLKTAEADQSLAYGASWPNLKIGPSFQTQSGALNNSQGYGIALSLPLPLYQANGGGRAYAAKGIAASEVTLETGGNQLQTERQQELLRYQSALNAMQESGTLRDVDKRHQNLERLFKGGLIISSMVIEAHRQIVDLTRNINEQELLAIRALWRIYAIEGRVLKEKI